MAGFLASVPLGLALVVMTPGSTARVAVTIYMVTLLGGFGISAAYHRVDWSPPVRLRMQVLDHSMTFVVIAGCYAPWCMLALPADRGRYLITVVITVVTVGVLVKLVAFHRLRWLGHGLYLVLGYAMVIALPDLLSSLSVLQMSLVVAAGLLYTLGFAVVVFRRPDPWPTVFGYHEVWHALTVVAAGLHYAAVVTLRA